MTLEVLHDDNHVLAIAKPAGVPVVPDKSGDPSLLELAREWVRVKYAKPGEVFLGVVHRLDRPVSGVVVFARTSKSAARLSEQFRAKTARKLYWGSVVGAPAGAAGIVEHWLLKSEEQNVVSVVREGTPGAKLARTRWSVIEPPGGGRPRYTRLRLEPETGRSHQLRVACASLGAPLAGDLKYGAREPLPDRSIALHAVQLELEHPTLREPLRIACDPPDRPWWTLR